MGPNLGSYQFFDPPDPLLAFYTDTQPDILRIYYTVSNFRKFCQENKCLFWVLRAHIGNNLSPPLLRKPISEDIMSTAYEHTGPGRHVHAFAEHRQIEPDRRIPFEPLILPDSIAVGAPALTGAFNRVYGVGTPLDLSF